MKMRTRASKASMDKRVKKCESTDWLISIPLELLHHILSFIDMKELIQMSVLSKNWRYMWKSLPTINISQEFWKGDEYEYPGSAFQYFVDKVLVGRDDSSDIYKFSLIVCEDFEEEEFPPIMFDGYINVVRISNVQEIHLGAIPEIFVSTLISLAEQVKVLKLASISFHSDEEEFNVNSSTLESLSLEECCVDFEGIIIHAPKLRYLVIDNNDNDACKIEIHAPNLTLLHLRGYMYGEYSMGDLPLLVDAHIDTLNVCKEKRGLVRRLNTLLKGLVHAQTLTISAHAFQMYAELPNMMKATSFPNLRYLKLTNWHNNGHISALSILFENSSCIRALVLERTEGNSKSADKNVDWGKHLGFHYTFSKLKSIEIKNLGGCQNELVFLELLLKNAPLLENLTITTVKALSMDKVNRLAKISKNLQSLPKASSNLTVLFHLNSGA